jgi:hypothetical protein
MKDNSKPVTEREMRTRVIKMAKLLGCVPEVETIFKKYDSLLKNCVDPTERYQMGLAGVSELHALMGMRGALIVNGQIIMPQAENFDPNKYLISE